MERIIPRATVARERERDRTLSLTTSIQYHRKVTLSPSYCPSLIAASAFKREPLTKRNMWYFQIRHDYGVQGNEVFKIPIRWTRVLPQVNQLWVFIQIFLQKIVNNRYILFLPSLLLFYQFIDCKVCVTSPNSAVIQWSIEKL